jgi:hypothetical protein
VHAPFQGKSARSVDLASEGCREPTRAAADPLQALLDCAPPVRQLHGTARVLRRAAGAPRPAVVQRERSTNPGRKDEADYLLPPPGEEGQDPIAMTEHHIVPHARIVQVMRKMGQAKTVAFMPSWENVSVREMTKLKGGWKADWVASAGLDLDAMASDNVQALRDWAAESGSDDDKRDINRAWRSWATSFRGGDEPDTDWGAAYFEWIPGNIVKGPTDRKHDMGAGDRLDTELVFLLRQMGEGGHADAAEDADARARTFVALAHPTEEQKEAIKDVFLALAAFGYTEYDDAQRARWEAAEGGGFQVTGYGGNQ